MDSRESVGLCASCAHASVVTSSRGSVFYLCRLSFTDPRFAKYPSLPVLRCSGYSPTEEHKEIEEKRREIGEIGEEK